MVTAKFIQQENVGRVTKTNFKNFKYGVHRMKHFITAICFLAAMSFSQLSFASGCSLTKSLYDSGKYSRALKLAKTYANYGDACAEFYLGLMYLTGNGVTANSEKGDAYIQSAAKKGFQPAINYLSNVLP